MEKIPYKLPLLAQGLPIRTVTTAAPLVTFNNRIQVNRGTVYMVRPCYLDGFIPYSTPNDYTGCVVTLNAGGQTLIRETIVDNWGSNVDRGDDTDQLIRCNLSDAQTFDESFDYTTPGTQLVFTYQSVLYYTNPEQSRFMDGYKWGAGLGLKRQTFRGIVAQGTNTPGYFTVAEGTIPTGNGWCIGAQLEYYPLTAFWLATFNLLIDGITIIKDVSVNYFTSLSQVNPQFFKALLQPGSTFELQINLNGSVPGVSDQLCAVTFFFEN